MTRSMTGYGRSSACGGYVVEVHSVNRKGLEFSMQMPRELLFLDVPLRKKLSSVLSRGHVTCRLSISRDERALDVSRLAGVKEQWEAVCQSLGLSSSEVTLSFLLEQLKSQPIELSNEEQQSLFEALDEALSALVKMKKIEGEALAQDILERLKVIERDLKLVLQGSARLVSIYGKKISDRLEEIGFLDDDLKDRAAKEIALLAEKMDITEEKVRLEAHIKRFTQLLASQATSVGRVLEFLSQEMLREVNTIGSKVQDQEVSALVISMKSELDRIREQVQNIE